MAKHPVMRSLLIVKSRYAFKMVLTAKILKVYNLLPGTELGSIEGEEWSMAVHVEELYFE